MEKQVKYFMSKNLITIKDSQDIGVADDLMNNYNIRHLPVVDENDILVGILSSHDYFALKKAGVRLDSIIVREFMNAPVKVVDRYAKLTDVALMFVQKKINSVIVADQEAAVGILTSEDILKAFLRFSDEEENSSLLSLDDLVDEEWLSRTTLI